MAVVFSKIKYTAGELQKAKEQRYKELRRARENDEKHIYDIIRNFKKKGKKQERLQLIMGGTGLWVVDTNRPDNQVLRPEILKCKCEEKKHSEEVISGCRVCTSIVPRYLANDQSLHIQFTYGNSCVIIKGQSVSFCSKPTSVFEKLVFDLEYNI